MARKSLGAAASSAADVPTRADVQALISAAGVGGGFPSTLAIAVRQSQAVNMSTFSFATVSLPTKSYDPNNLFDTATMTYAVPSAGTYLCVASIRLDDNSGAAGAGLGLGVHTANSDVPSFFWSAVPSVTRRLLPYTRLAQFVANDKLRLYYYYDSSTAAAINSASLSIIRIA